MQALELLHGAGQCVLGVFPGFGGIALVKLGNEPL